MFTDSPEVVPSGIIKRYTRDVYGITEVVPSGIIIRFTRDVYGITRVSSQWYYITLYSWCLRIHPS